MKALWLTKVSVPKVIIVTSVVNVVVLDTFTDLTVTEISTLLISFVVLAVGIKYIWGTKS